MTSLPLLAALVALAPSPQPPAPTACQTCFGESTPLWPVKGGLALLADGIYVGVSTPRNLIIIQETQGGGRSSERRWTGKPADLPEVVLLFQRQVVDPAAPPRGFDLAKATVISFERDQVRILQATGGSHVERITSPGERPDAPRLPPEAFKGIDASLLVADIVERLGPPHGHGGFGLCYLFWEATDGQRLSVGTTGCALSERPMGVSLGRPEQ